MKLINIFTTQFIVMFSCLFGSIYSNSNLQKTLLNYTVTLNNQTGTEVDISTFYNLHYTQAIRKETRKLPAFSLKLTNTMLYNVDYYLLV